jgi:Uma2 family endonuclease
VRDKSLVNASPNSKSQVLKEFHRLQSEKKESDYEHELNLEAMQECLI